MESLKIEEALTFDDILLVPNRSGVLPKETQVGSRLSRNINLNIPILSAAMDSVTESETAIVMAQAGGIGIIHKNLSIVEQAKEVRKVKKSESGIIPDPVTIQSKSKLKEALKIMREHSISGVPVLEGENLVGILTNRDLRFENDLERPVSELMTKDLVTVKSNVDLKEAKRLLHQHRIEKLLVVDEASKLSGLITIKDIEKADAFPDAAKDLKGRLLVGAAIGVGEDAIHRARALAEVGVDVLVVDTAHGHTEAVISTVRLVKKEFPQIDVIAGNIATADAVRDLAEAGVDAVKVGIGPGSICTTRIVAGIGVPQITAIWNCSQAAKEFGIPVIADGGIKYSGDLTKAIALGADTIMIGSLFAGTDESPGERILYQGRTYKAYRGMGSLGAMAQGSSDRYFQEPGQDAGKYVPEGIEGMVPYRGKLIENIFQLVGGLKSGMGYCGAETLLDLKAKARFVKISSSGLKESHVHDVTITKEAPNYHRD